MDTKTQQVPIWFMVSGFITVALLITGIVVEPSRPLNEWTIASVVVSAIGFSALFITKLKKEK